MKKFKRFLALFAAVAMLFTLTACGGSGGGSSNVSIPTVDKMTIYDKDGVTITFDGLNNTEESIYAVEHGYLTVSYYLTNSSSREVTFESLYINNYKLPEGTPYGGGEGWKDGAAFESKHFVIPIEDLKKANIRKIDSITFTFEFSDLGTVPLKVDLTK